MFVKFNKQRCSKSVISIRIGKKVSAPPPHLVARGSNNRGAELITNQAS